MNEFGDSGRIAFIGAGRLATGLALAFQAAGEQVRAVASRDPNSARALAARLPSCQPISAQDAVDAGELVFITVPDDAIARVAAGLRWRQGQFVVHCSGATEVSVLAPAAQSGAVIGGFHPMQSFTNPDVAVASLPGCAVAVEAMEPLFARLTRLARSIECRPFALPAGVRARYHATGSYAAQFVNALLLEASVVWESFGMDRDTAVRAHLPLLKGTVAAIEHDGLVRGLSGPISRGDAGTLRRNLEGIASVGDDTLALYRQLARRALSLAIERGSLTPAQVDALKALLDDKLRDPS